MRTTLRLLTGFFALACAATCVVHASGGEWVWAVFDGTLSVANLAEFGKTFERAP